MNIPYKRLLSLVVSAVLVMQIAAPMSVFAANTQRALNFTVHDTVSDGQYLYVSVPADSMVHRIEIATGSQKNLRFPNLKPESLYLQNRKLFVGLCDAERPHDLGCNA